MSPKKTSQPKLHTMFAVQAGGRTEPLEVDVCKLFKEAVLTGEVDNIIKKAFEYCQVELQGPPLGHASPVRPMADLLSFAGQDTSRSGLTSTIFGGCLHHVALATHAIGQSTDVGKVGDGGGKVGDGGKGAAMSEVYRIPVDHVPGALPFFWLVHTCTPIVY